LEEWGGMRIFNHRYGRNMFFFVEQLEKYGFERFFFGIFSNTTGDFK